MVKKCLDCEVILTDENTYPTYSKKCYYVCKSCAIKRATKISNKRYTADPEFRKRMHANCKKWVNENREHYNSYMREYERKNILSTNGKKIRVKKRPRTENCEVCGRSFRRLGYHHWDDMNMSKGIWLCSFCHLLAEIVDTFPENKLVQTYLTLKNSIELESQKIKVLSG